MYTADDYKAISRKRVQGWGQGLTLAFLVALLQNRKLVSNI
jgi:unsaturated rhamnogalacturonyl hydrolase